MHCQTKYMSFYLTNVSVQFRFDFNLKKCTISVVARTSSFHILCFFTLTKYFAKSQSIIQISRTNHASPRSIPNLLATYAAILELQRIQIYIYIYSNAISTFQTNITVDVLKCQFWSVRNSSLYMPSPPPPE